MKARRSRAVTAAVCMGAALFGLAIEGCRLLEGEPPFRYLTATLITGEAPGCHSVLGLHYSIQNVVGTCITGIRASFDLYDAEGAQLPSPGSNHFDLAFTGSIAPGTSWAICTSLDSSFFYLPKGPLVGERFRIYRVELADGSVWTDPLALYTYPYRLTTDSGDQNEESTQ